MNTTAPNHRRTITRLSLAAAGMFGFAFALVPLYDLICDLTGLGGRTSSEVYQYDPAAVTPDRSRIVTVTFLTNANANMPWAFEPLTRSVKVFPGELKEVMFRVHNPTNKTMVAQAIPSLLPISVVDQFHKTECFCFRSQELKPGETLDMPMRFVLDRELPKQIQSIQLAYTLFDITSSANSTTVRTAQLPANSNVLQRSKMNG